MTCPFVDTYPPLYLFHIVEEQIPEIIAVTAPKEEKQNFWKTRRRLTRKPRTALEKRQMEIEKRRRARRGQKTLKERLRNKMVISKTLLTDLMILSLFYVRKYLALVAHEPTLF